MLIELKQEDLTSVSGGYEPDGTEDVYCYQTKNLEEENPYTCDVYSSQGEPVTTFTHSEDATNYTGSAYDRNNWVMFLACGSRPYQFGGWHNKNTT